jgi:hypothetical protein
MTNENSDAAGDFSLIASRYIDAFAGRAKAIAELSSPFVEEIAAAVRAFRDASGAPSRERRETQGEGQGWGAVVLGVMKQQPVASLAVVGALGAAGYYLVRAQKAG